MVDEQDESELDGEVNEDDEPEPDPGPDTLEPMLDLLEEMESHRTRLKMIVQQGVGDPNVPMHELVDTAMSLLQDLANRCYENLYEIRRYLVEQVEPLVLGEGGGEEGYQPSNGGIYIVHLVHIIGHMGNGNGIWNEAQRIQHHRSSFGGNGFLT